MKMKLLFFLLIILIFLVGCTSSTGIPTNELFLTGYNGVSIQFVRNTPPSEITERTPFVIGIDAHNRGPVDVSQAFLVLSYDRDYIRLHSGDSKVIALEGRNVFNPSGELRSFFFEGETRSLDQESLRRDVPIIASLCYRYNTTLSDVFCLDQTYSSSQERGRVICRPEDKRYSGQGGPVGISSVDMTILSSSSSMAAHVYFDIIIRHSGRGIVINPDNYRQVCTSGSPGEHINKVRVVTATLSDIPLTCSEEELILRNNEARLRCQTIQAINVAAFPFNAPLVVQLDYGYIESTTKNIQIIRR